jgi:hypothetical protein
VSPSSALLLGLALVLPGASCNRDRTPQRTATPKPQRTATPKPGTPTIAGDPLPGPPLSEVFANATWLRVDPASGPNGAAELVDPPRVSTQDGRFGKIVLALKRAAFGTHVVRRGEVGPIDVDDLDDLDVERASHVYLFGPARTCVAVTTTTRAVVLDDFGRELELRHLLEGCGPGPHAPLGLVAERVPMQLGWVPASCDDDARWAAAETAVAREVDAPTRVGTLTLGNDVVAHVLASDETLHVAIAAERGGPIVRSIIDIDARAVGIACDTPGV